MKKVRGHGRGNLVFTWKDFHDLGPRGSIDQALARLANAGKLRRVARGMYDLPRTSKLLSGPAPANADAVIDAVQRHDRVTIKPDDLAAANAFGLTTAVLVQPRYRTSGGRRTIKVGRSTIKLRPAGRKLELWLDTPAAPIVQALVWLHDRKLDHDDTAIAKLRDRSTPAARESLARGLHTLPGWAIPLARNIAGNHANLAA